MLLLRDPRVQLPFIAAKSALLSYVQLCVPQNSLVLFCKAAFCPFNANSILVQGINPLCVCDFTSPFVRACPIPPACWCPSWISALPSMLTAPPRWVLYFLWIGCKGTVSITLVVNKGTKRCWPNYQSLKACHSYPAASWTLYHTSQHFAPSGPDSLLFTLQVTCQFLPYPIRLEGYYGRQCQRSCQSVQHPLLSPCPVSQSSHHRVVSKEHFLHRLPGHWNETTWPVVPQTTLLAFLKVSVSLTFFQSSGSYPDCVFLQLLIDKPLLSQAEEKIH